MKQIFSRTL